MRPSDTTLTLLMCFGGNNENLHFHHFRAQKKLKKSDFSVSKLVTNSLI